MSVAIKTGNNLTVLIPDLTSSLAQIAMVCDPKNAKKVYRKGISAGGRVLLKKAKELAPNSKVRQGKKAPKGRYGRSGLLKKSLAMYYRTGKTGNRPYIVIGANRNVSADLPRGKQTTKETPAKTIHLVEDGFTAVSRISLDGTRAGLVKGSELKNKVLNLLRGQRGFMVKASSINLKNALAQGFDKKLMTSDSLGSRLQKQKVGLDEVKAYVKGYKKATKTASRPRKFLERAAKAAREPAIAKAVEVLRSEYDRLISVFRVK
jgi:hypothetical protein